MDDYVRTTRFDFSVNFRLSMGRVEFFGLYSACIQSDGTTVASILTTKLDTANSSIHDKKC